MTNNFEAQKSVADHVVSPSIDQQAAMEAVNLNLQIKQENVARLGLEVAKGVAALFEVRRATPGNDSLLVQELKILSDKWFDARLDMLQTIQAEVEAAWNVLCPPIDPADPEVTITSMAKELNEKFKDVLGFVPIPTDINAIRKIGYERKLKKGEPKAEQAD